ncbi:UNVERIFIED_CONTAM: hypothetical protein Sradi_5324400 [Sesamum radiatum]|uniref:Uncharacterized protein n=1 Tax=Sesamum radiatum TaxID=300843 RepID=A0AAW2LN73_SESRA
MAQEEDFFGCSYSSGGGGGSGGRAAGGGGGGGGVSSSRSKTVKQKKVPQRGLGVAQLEKIRLEEQQKKESLQVANILAKIQLVHLVIMLSSWLFNAPNLGQMNSSTGISPSSILSSQMEPPSNQSSRGNNYVPSWSEEEKMVGMKRSYPFLVESQPSRSLNCNFHPSYAASLSRSDEFDSCSNGYKAHMEPRNKCIRESSSNSSPQPEQNPSEVNRDKRLLNGDFLTLAPPVVVSPPSNSEQKNTLDYSGYQRPKLYEYERMPCQDYAKRHIHHPGPSGSVERSVSFLPITLQIDQTTTRVSNGNGEKTETIDLSLKL